MTPKVVAWPTGQRTCPWCGYLVTHASEPRATVMASPDPGWHGPEPGDWLLCLGCGEWGVEAEDHQIRRPDEAEFALIATDPDCARARAAWVKTVRSAH